MSCEAKIPVVDRGLFSNLLKQSIDLPSLSILRSLQDARQILSLAVVEEQPTSKEEAMPATAQTKTEEESYVPPATSGDTIVTVSSDAALAENKKKEKKEKRARGRATKEGHADSPAPKKGKNAEQAKHSQRRVSKECLGMQALPSTPTRKPRREKCSRCRLDLAEWPFCGSTGQPHTTPVVTNTS